MVVSPVHQSSEVTESSNEVTHTEESTSLEKGESPSNGCVVPVKILDPTDVFIDEDRELNPATQLKYKCGENCPCRNQLEFSRRLRNLPPVTSLTTFYETLKTWNPLFNCMFTSAEIAVLLATVPARLVSTQLRSTLSTPAHIADLVMCRGLDLAERAFPCLIQPPAKSFTNLALCACGVPVASCYMCSKLACKTARTCLCDIPAVACGAPALACISATEICTCDVPRGICCLPASVVTTALRNGLADVEDIFKDVKNASRLYDGR